MRIENRKCHVLAMVDKQSIVICWGLITIIGTTLKKVGGTWEDTLFCN